MTATRVLLLCLCLFAFGPQKAHAAEFSGAYLLYVCSADKDGKEIVPGGFITCQSYIAGVLDYHNLIRSLGTSPSVDFCVPENASLFMLQEVVVQYIARNKEQHGPFVASPAVALALFEAFPCR